MTNTNTERFIICGGTNIGIQCRTSSLIGEVFGRLTVIDRASDYIQPNGRRLPRWVCNCACGNKCSPLACNLKSGDTQSCGCLLAQQSSIANSKHGASSTREYAVWQGMKQRCYYPRHKDYSRYGGRGIRVCDAWLNSFEQFRNDMGSKPTPSHSLDRINNDGDYEPGNVRWATAKTQAKNRKRNTQSQDRIGV